MFNYRNINTQKQTHTFTLYSTDIYGFAASTIIMLKHTLPRKLFAGVKGLTLQNPREWEWIFRLTAKALLTRETKHTHTLTQKTRQRYHNSSSSFVCCWYVNLSYCSLVTLSMMMMLSKAMTSTLRMQLHSLNEEEKHEMNTRLHLHTNPLILGRHDYNSDLHTAAQTHSHTYEIRERELLLPA